MALPSCFQAPFVNSSRFPAPVPAPPTPVTKVYDDVIRFIKQGKIKEAKNIVRTQHWPIDHLNRGELWLKLCQGHVKVGPPDDYYQSTVKESLDGQWPSGMPAFADPIFDEVYLLSAEGQRRAERVLYVVSVNYPFITYCPILHPVVCLLLHYLTEEQTYECACALIEGTIVRHLSQTRLMYDTSAHTLMKLTKNLAKKTYNKLLRKVQQEEDLEKVFLTWQLWIFRGLPFYHLVRTMDCFLIEGVRALYRAAMAILILFVQDHSSEYPNESMFARMFGGKKSKSKAPGPSGEGGLDAAAAFLDRIILYLRDLPYNVDSFLKTAYGIQGVSAKVLNDQLLKSEAYVRGHPGKRLLGSPSETGASASRLEVTSSLLPIKKSRYGTSTSVPVGIAQLTNFHSEILSRDQMCVLWTWLPARITMLQPELVYSTNEHGSSLTNFYVHSDTWEPTVLVVLTTRGERFGAYCSTRWQERKQTYFGTGETFLFTFSPEAKRFAWVGVGSSRDVPHSAKLFMSANQTMILVGGGNGMGLYIDQSLENGRSEHCDTFDNDPLGRTSDFVVNILEVIGFA
ncbi:GTPase-activating protein skywalker-like [Dermacentor andersoni]|uniref:GTPase-activating protein skywalker-like n=1 Tax=Dermacentor andersoni TaxID=34620 RepID=UPI00215528F4|nr:GTPase-activating protein skywalker-like [Dermacentor andersoni]